jgi:hypothetical protein
VSFGSLQSRIFGAVEALEDTRSRRLRNANAGILNVQRNDPAALSSSPNGSRRRALISGDDGGAAFRWDNHQWPKAR